ncbi:uncharacterized protein LOC142493757 [Ascaphus truei]|uniref:uncharacterized protein LOC142493757 n=1 Tax=Ascaphus truei TaxID=8439 RepID=UPI003F5A02BA
MSLQASIMQLLVEAHKHEEGWFERQLQALVHEAGSNQSGSSGRESKQGDSEAWPSSSDEGGPSGGARHAVALHKGKSGAVGTRSTSLHGAGMWSAAHKRAGRTVRSSKKGEKGTCRGAGPDRRFASLPGTGASQGKRKKTSGANKGGSTLPGIASSPIPQLSDLGETNDAEARLITVVVKGVQVALLAVGLGKSSGAQEGISRAGATPVAATQELVQGAVGVEGPRVQIARHHQSVRKRQPR